MYQDKKEIHGFKCFNKGLITRYGDHMELNKIYKTNEKPIFRNSGFHMCKRMEDTLRYFDAFDGEVDICRVIGYPEYHEYCDEYYGYYNMYSCQQIILTELLNRQQILEEADQMFDSRFKRFSSQFHLNYDELKYFINKYKSNKDVLSNLIYCYYDEKVYEKIRKGENFDELAKKYIKN